MQKITFKSWKDNTLPARRDLITGNALQWAETPRALAQLY